MPSFDTFDSLAGKITEAKLDGIVDEDGLPTIETDEKLIKFYLKKPGDIAEFERTGFFIMNGVKVKKKDG